MRSVNFSYAQTASQEFDELFDKVHVFDNPKNFKDISRLIEYLTDANDIVVAFFAGSGTTGHSVLDVNRRHSPSRRFVCVQLPEPIKDDTHTGQNALNLGYKTIADIGKVRIESVIKRMHENGNGKMKLETRDTPEDLGFRVFKLAPSSYRQWKPPEERDVDAYAEQMELMLDPLLPGWTVEHVTWEAAVKEGYALGSRVEPVEAVTGHAVHHVTDLDRGQSFFICLDEKIALPALKPLGLTRDTTFICRDSALTDETAVNLSLQCRLKTI